MEPILVINRRLKETYGHVNNKARYRLTWSTTELEKRRGTFNDFYGNIFIRQVTGVREVPKYPAFPERWVLEVLCPPLGADEVIDHNGYEPLFVFEKDSQYLDPVWFAITFIISRVEAPVKRTAKDIIDEENSVQAKEERDFLEYLTEHEAGPLSTKEAIVVPELKEN